MLRECAVYVPRLAEYPALLRAWTGWTAGHGCPGAHFRQRNKGCRGHSTPWHDLDGVWPMSRSHIRLPEQDRGRQGSSFGAHSHAGRQAWRGLIPLRLVTGERMSRGLFGDGPPPGRGLGGNAAGLQVRVFSRFSTGRAGLLRSVISGVPADLDRCGKASYFAHDAGASLRLGPRG